MAVGDTYRIIAQTQQSGAVVPLVFFIKQLSPTALVPAQQAATAFDYAFSTWLSPQLSDQLGDSFIRVDSLNPATPETWGQSYSFSGPQGADPVSPSFPVRVQANPRGDVKQPSQIVNVPGITVDQVDANGLTTAARNAWNLAAANFLAAFSLPPLGVVWQPQIVPYGSMAYPLPDPGTAIPIDSMVVAQTLGQQPILNIRIR